VHSFDPNIASITGVPEAILFQHIRNKVKRAISQDKNIIDGKGWYFGSTSTLNVIFPYLHRVTIYRSLKNLENRGFIKIGNHNEKSYDKTMWFTIEDWYYPDQTSKQPKNLEGFEEWWNLYGKKRNRRLCEKLWSRIHIDATDTIIAHTKYYITDSPDPKYRKDPERYLKYKLWEDEGWKDIIEDFSNHPLSDAIQFVRAYAEKNGWEIRRQAIETESILFSDGGQFYQFDYSDRKLKKVA